MHFEHLKITVFLDFESTHDSRTRASERGREPAMPKSGACRERGKRSGLASTTRPQALCALGKRTQRPAVAAAAVVTAVVAAAAAPLCSTLRCDPETRSAVPRAGLRRHAFAVRLAGLLLSCNKKTPPPKSCPKIARLGPPQAREEANDKRAAGGGKN
jgi:hypothetical protein